MGDWEYVGFWKRVVATIVDTIAMLLITSPILLAVYGWGYWQSSKFIQGPVDLLVTWILPTALIIWLWSRFGATPGKMLLGARIVDAETGGPPTTGQLLGRYAGYFLSMIPFFLGCIWVAFDARKQGWHDKLAGTVVIQSRAINATPVGFKPDLRN